MGSWSWHLLMIFIAYCHFPLSNIGRPCHLIDHPRHHQMSLWLKVNQDCKVKIISKPQNAWLIYWFKQLNNLPKSINFFQLEIFVLMWCLIWQTDIASLHIAITFTPAIRVVAVAGLVIPRGLTSHSCSMWRERNVSKPWILLSEPAQYPLTK